MATKNLNTFSEKLAASPKIDSKMMAQPSSPGPNDVFEKERRQRPYLPDIWDNSKRMSVLFCEFRSREANPEGWDSKMKFWINAINEWTEKTQSVCFTLEELRDAFERNGSRPQIKSLQLVLSEMQRRQVVFSRENFPRCLQSNQSSWVSWGFKNFVVRPLSWSYSMLSGSEESVSEEINESIQSDTKLVSLNSLQGLCQKVENYLAESNLALNCVPYKTVVEKVNQQLGIKTETMEYIRQVLEAQQKMKVVTEGGFTICRFGVNPSISEGDIVLNKLEFATKTLNTEIRKLDEESEEYKKQARLCVRENNRTKAKMLLRKKKRLEDLIVKKEQQLDNIAMLFERLQEVETQKQILHAFQDVSKTLKNVQADPDKAESIVQDLEDVFAQQEMLSDVEKSFSHLANVDDLEVEEELNEILKEASADTKLEKELEEMLNQLEVYDDKIEDVKEKRKAEIAK